MEENGDAGTRLESELVERATAEVEGGSVGERLALWRSSTRTSRCGMDSSVPEACSASVDDVVPFW